MTICCKKLYEVINDKYGSLQYSSALREYWVRLIDDYDELGIISNNTAIQLLSFCPFCGTRLPESLRDQWVNELETLGFDEPFDQDIPNDYTSDSWWKRRVSNGI